MTMQFMNGQLKSRRWRRAAFVPAMMLLSGCGLDFSLVPMAGEPDRTELTEWQHKRLLDAPLAALPEDIAASLPNDGVADAARFLTRTLETAPDGQQRLWRSIDGQTVLAIRPVSTAADGETVCRRAVLSLETAGTRRDFDLRACRSSNGIWTP